MDIITAVRNIPVVYHESIFRIISQYNVHYTKNQNGTFINLENLNVEGLDAVRQHIETIYKHMQTRQKPMNQNMDFAVHPTSLNTQDLTQTSNEAKSQMESVPLPNLNKRKKATNLTKRSQAILSAIRRIEREGRVNVPVSRAAIGETTDRADKGDEDQEPDQDVDIDIHMDRDISGIDNTMDHEGLDIHTADVEDSEEEELSDFGENSSDDGQIDDMMQEHATADETRDHKTNAKIGSKYVTAHALCEFLKSKVEDSLNTKIDKMEPILKKLKFPVPRIEN